MYKKENYEAAIKDNSIITGKLSVTEGMTKENMVVESTVFDEIKMEDTKGVYKNKSEANRLAGESLKAFEDQLKEVESSMEEYRSAQKAIKEKAKETKDKINKIK